MDKSKFERFINLYLLNKVCEKATFVATATDLTVKTVSDDKNVMAEVSGPKNDVPDGQFSVFESSQLLSLLKVLGDTVTPTTITSNGVVTALQFSDSTTDVVFALADAAVIPPYPQFKTAFTADLTIALDGAFIRNFIRGVSAIKEKDADVFTVSSDGVKNSALIVLGDASNSNSNKIKFKLKIDTPVAFTTRAFSAKYLKEILLLNKGSDSLTNTGTTPPTLELNAKGLARLSFKDDGITSTYYLRAIS